VTPESPPRGPVLAAGGVVWRRRADGEVEVVLVHRPRYDDWSLPKGKLDPGETDEQAALREVQEETTVLAELGPELPSTIYLDKSGKHKRVRYWAMTIVDGLPAASNEVDAVIWLPVGEAVARLTYRHDVDVLVALPNAIGPQIL